MDNFKKEGRDEMELNDQNIALIEFDEELGDPKPPGNEESDVVWSLYKTDVAAYSDEMLSAFKTTNMVGKNFWIEFTATFNPCTFLHMTKTMQLKWVNILIERGVYVTRKQGYARSKALKDCLTSEDFIPYREPKESSDKSRSKEQMLVNGNLKVNRDKHELKSLPTEKINNNEGDESISQLRNRMGMSGFIKSFSGRKKYSGLWSENLDETIEVYESMARLCQLTKDEMASALPLTLTGDALSFFTRNYNREKTYHDILTEMKEWYTSDQQRQRLLRKWQSIRLSKFMKETPEKSESDVFQKLSLELTQTQRQLSKHYRHDDFLRDQLIIAVDIPNIQQALRERVPSSAQEAVQRIATFLSNEPGSAGSYLSDDAMISVNGTYGGNARKTMKGSRLKNGKNNCIRLSSRWLAGQNGCWVCGKSHKAKERHSKEEIVEAIEKLRSRQPNAMLTVEDLALISNDLAANGSDEDNESKNEDESHGNHIVFSEDETDESYFTCDEAPLHKQHEEHFANVAFVHGRNYNYDHSYALGIMHREIRQGEEERFNGIFLDTCANRSSVMSYKQYKAYCKEFNVPFNIERGEQRGIRGVGGSAKIIGSANIPVPFRDLKLVIDVQFRIVNEKVPSLLSNKDMIDNGLDISLQRKTISHGKQEQSLDFENYFLIHRWRSDDISYSMYTEKELRKLHRVFGHPSVRALTNLLRRADPRAMNPSVVEAVKEITHACTICATHAKRPRRFKLTVGTDDLRFNHVIAVDIMFLRGRPTLHIVDEATHFNQAKFLTNHKSMTVWKAILRAWIRTYSGPPDFIRVDQGSNLVSSEFLDCADAEGISVLPAPVESPNTMTHVERYHAPLRVAYEKIRDSLPRSESDDECLEMAVKSVNDTIGPEGLCPTLLVFGIIPRISQRHPAPSQVERAKAIDSAMDLVRKEQAKRRIAFGLRHGSGPKGVEQSEELRKLPSNSPVLVYRETENKWLGPYPLIQVDGETVVVQLPSGRKIFRSTVVKPANGSKFSAEKPRESEDNANDDDISSLFRSGIDPSELLEHIPDSAILALFEEDDISCLSVEANKECNFKASREQELNNLLKQEVFEIVPLKLVPKGKRIYGTRWVDVLKTTNGKSFEKSRLVAQNYRDRDATTIPTRSPTISRFGQRIAVATAAMFPHHTAFIRDISQAYIQSKEHLKRKVYLRPPKELGLKTDQVLLAKKPLYGIPESGLYWFITYKNHHINELNMNSTSGDSCLLYKSKEGYVDGVVTLQVDDTFGHGSSEFLELEDEKSKAFICKPRNLLKPEESQNFNGSTILYDKAGDYHLHQKEKLSNIQLPQTKEDLISLRAKLQYIGCSTRPDLCAQVQLLANEVQDPTEKTFKAIRKLVEWCRKTSNLGLKYTYINPKEVRLMVFTDSSFANLHDLRSQIGFVVLATNDSGSANILHFGSTRCKRIARSVMAAELLALVHGFDHAFLVKHCMSEILGREIPLDAFIDSRTVFNTVAKTAPTLEKRLLIDVCALRESHGKGELRNISWIPSDENVADGLTKGLIGKNHCLYRLMETNKIVVHPEGWMNKNI